MAAESSMGLNAAIDDAQEEVLGSPESTDIELYGQLRTLIRNCVADNYDESDVRAVIQLAFAADVVGEEGEDD